MQGKTINGYTLQQQLGVGGMAEVWLAENAIGKKAAVKLLLPKFCGDEAIVARFQNEAKVMVQLDHPNIRQVYDYGSIDGRPCIVMEYLEGDDLKALMKSGKRFTDAELRQWWNQIADALNYTHAKGIVHRDIKPSNIFMDKKGNIKLLDFGIAKIKESISMTQTGAMMGTLMYMSPEQVEDSKHIGPESDNYSLAVTFVHLLTGKAPYDSTTSSDYAIRKGIVEQELDLSALPSSWRDFLKPYLAKKPNDRPALRAFEAVASEAPTPPTESDDEGTIVGDVPKKQEQKKVEPKPVEKPEPKNEGKSQNKKKGLWIGLGIAAAIVLLVLLLRPKSAPQAYEISSQTNTPSATLTGTANGHEWVDLGLPSGLLWATCNVGASTPEDYGNYYAWGENSTKSTYNWDTYKYANGAGDKLTKYCSRSDCGNNGFTDKLTTLQAGDDPTTTNWGSDWRMPSKEQWEELFANTTNQWTTQNGKAGRLFTSKTNGQTLFLPAAGCRYDGSLDDAGSRGYYWSSSLYTDFPYNAWYFRFYSGGYSMRGYDRHFGFTVRPVCSSRQN